MVDTSIAIQLVVFSVLLGGIYALVAIGLTLIFGVMDIINFAHGAMMVLGMYLVWYLAILTGFNPISIIPVAMIFLFSLGIVIYVSTLGPIENSPQENQLIVTFGILLIIVSLIEMTFSPDPRQYPVDLGSTQIGELFIPTGQFIAFIFAVVFIILVRQFLISTELGMKIRATADNKDGAQFVGVNVRKINYLTFGIGAGLAGLAGGVVPLFQTFDPFIGDKWLINSFVVVVLGGLGSFPGALIGGIIIGFVQVFGLFLLPGSLYQVLIFSIFIMMLALKPNGLLGDRKYV